ncbi:hypothetical protein AAL_07110 [Moelleriella libera RCEF 2490]|uniref:Uncharacterized protein n=1 Tax=Moelleriella libera RCEF 2490 TaxID=1081109 RepID=A0A167XSM4_9HYPO|nr:hypothetical protein AAL_07110 [Moelleriella libera RCEF 2490]
MLLPSKTSHNPQARLLTSSIDDAEGTQAHDFISRPSRRCRLLFLSIPKPASQHVVPPRLAPISGNAGRPLVHQKRRLDGDDDDDDDDDDNSNSSDISNDDTKFFEEGNSFCPLESAQRPRETYPSPAAIPPTPAADVELPEGMILREMTAWIDALPERMFGSLGGAGNELKMPRRSSDGRRLTWEKLAEELARSPRRARLPRQVAAGSLPAANLMGLVTPREKFGAEVNGTSGGFTGYFFS